MLTRVYLDNYRCFTNCELALGPRQLLFGRNGTGKSSLLVALLGLRDFLLRGVPVAEQFPAWLLTRNSTSSMQVFEIGCLLGGENFLYRLELQQEAYPLKAAVLREYLFADGRMLFEFAAPEVRVLDEQGTVVSSYRSDPGRSALQNVLAVGAGTAGVHRFGEWLGGMQFFQIQPSQWATVSQREDRYPVGNLANFASWYRYLALADREADAAFLESLREVMEGFRHLNFLSAGEQKILQAHFAHGKSSPTAFNLTELSDGQRCLIGLYAILHFGLQRGHTVFIDEPDNFVALKEIQPWLLAVEDAVDSGSGQALLISHHPEIINQWAVDAGIRFYREESGPVRTTLLKNEGMGQQDGLTPAEMIARGWDE